MIAAIIIAIVLLLFVGGCVTHMRETGRVPRILTRWRVGGKVRKRYTWAKHEYTREERAAARRDSMANKTIG